jgi:hypothetical protein
MAVGRDWVWLEGNHDLAARAEDFALETLVAEVMADAPPELEGAR